MNDENINLWKIVIAPALISATPWIFKLYQMWSKRKDDGATRALTSAERREQTLFAEQESLSKERKENLAWVEAQRDRAEEETTKERLRRVDMEKDLERGWALARIHYRMGAELYFELTNLRFNYDTMALKHNEPIPTWKRFDFPQTIDAPLPKELP